MESFQTIIILMFFAVILIAIAQRLKIPYPIALVIGGAVLGFVPGLDRINLDPALALVLILPPLLFYAAYSMPFRKFRRNIVEICSLALGLVFFTTLCIGLLFKWLFPDLPWALAFAFGAIISPPDAVSATTILRRFSINPRLSTVLEGESLINDAMGLVLVKFALVALLSGFFSLREASLDLCKVVFGGIGLGLITGYLFNKLSTYFRDPILRVVFSFPFPYLAYIMADFIGVSGVLAVVCNALVGARMLTTHFSSATRLIGWTSWDIFVILLNCLVFTLIGSELHTITRNMTTEELLRYTAYGILITVVTVIIRMIWVYGYKFISFGYALRDPKCSQTVNTTMREAAILSWSGMRGIVSLTVALSLPYTLLDGSPLPGRDITIFITFVVIFLTIVVPGLTLPTLIRWLKIRPHSLDDDISGVRSILRKTAEEEVNRLLKSNKLTNDEFDFLKTYFNARHKILEFAYAKSRHALEQARLDVINMQRRHLVKMWEHNQIEDEVLHALERELDVTETVLTRAELQ